MKATSRINTTISTSQPPYVYTNSRARRTGSVFSSLGSRDLPARLRLGWPYIHGRWSDNDGNALINAVESAGVTGWDNMDFWDTEVVGCRWPIVRKIWCMGEVAKKDNNYRLSVGYRQRGKIGRNARRRRQWSRRRLIRGCELRQELGRRRPRSREGQLLRWRRSSCWLQLGEIGIFWKRDFLIFLSCGWVGERRLCVECRWDGGLYRILGSLYRFSRRTNTWSIHHHAKDWRGSLYCCEPRGINILILARMDGPGITISIILFFDRVFLLQRLRVRLDPSKNRHLNWLKLAQIRFAHLWQVISLPPPLPSDRYG